MSDGDFLQFVDDNGDVRIAGYLQDDGATVGDVLTVQSDGSIAAAAGGGSSSYVWRGPFNFTHATAGLTDGVPFYTPTVGDLIVDARIMVDTAFDGTTPFADIGSFSGVDNGWFSTLFSPYTGIDLTLQDSSTIGAGIRTSNNNPSDLIIATAGAGLPNVGPGMFPGLVTGANPLLLVVSQDGTKGGAATGATVGAGRVYLCTATPVALT